jgi:hypothetical protein
MAIPGLLSGAERHAVWQLMLRGASPALACQQLGVSIEALWRTLQRDTTFFLCLMQLYDTLDHNVVSALYRQALEGSVAAQKFWLERRPAVLWSPPPAQEVEPREFADLSNAELADWLHQADGDCAAADECVPTPPAV